MSSYQHFYVEGGGALNELAQRWNTLWQRSYARQPTARAKGIANWLRHFSQDHQFSALCVEDDGHLIAALPLVADRLSTVYPVYRLPVNSWANTGDFLVDRETNLRDVVSAVVDGLQAIAPSLLCFEEITLGAPQWIALQSAIRNRGGRTFCKRQSPVAVIDILGDWDSYQQSWSANHRGAVKRSYRKLTKQGELRTERCQQPGVHLEQMLRTAFAIEDRSWKGEAGTSVLRTPGVLDYMLDEAEAVARSGHVDLWLLYLEDRPIAFEYCHFAKGTCFSHKIGYDPALSKHGPGRLLRYLQLQEYHHQGDCRLLDTLGTLCQSKAKWATRSYNVGELYASVGSSTCNALLDGYAWATKSYRRWRGSTSAEVPKLGATSYLDTVTIETPTANIDGAVNPDGFATQTGQISSLK
ncbi:MAG: GNAT family N-acetyltransferase [Planctomycetota bacterium]